MTTKIHKQDALTVEIKSGEAPTDAIEVAFTGKSTAREPGTFLNPIFGEILRDAKESGRSVVMDFRKLEYMNSSTITPVIRMLHEVKGGTTKLSILFDESLRWQKLSFAALQVFKTDDGRVAIRGA